MLLSIIISFYRQWFEFVSLYMIFDEDNVICGLSVYALRYFGLKYVVSGIGIFSIRTIDEVEAGGFFSILYVLQFYGVAFTLTGVRSNVTSMLRLVVYVYGCLCCRVL